MYRKPHRKVTQLKSKFMLILLNWALNNLAQELCFQAWLNLYIKINRYWHTTKNSSLVSRPFPSLSNILKAISRPLFDSEQRQRNKSYSKKMIQCVLLLKLLLVLLHPILIYCSCRRIKMNKPYFFIFLLINSSILADNVLVTT